MLFASMTAAVLIVLIRAVTTPGLDLRSTMSGAGKFDVKNSWVSNTTLFGAVLASAIAAAAVCAYAWTTIGQHLETETPPKAAPDTRDERGETTRPATTTSNTASAAPREFALR